MVSLRFFAHSGYENHGMPIYKTIVADHVELLEQWFRDAIVERWRDGIKLVPQTWLKS